jgi:hypothetical protein
MIFGYELDRTLKGAAVAHSKILARQSPEEAQGYHEISQANGAEV